MSTVNVVSSVCRDAPVEKVLLFNDRAEIKRLIKTTLQPGTNEVHVQNVSHSTVCDSVRVDGRGDAIIQDVTRQEKYKTSEEIESPAIALLREAVAEAEANVATIKDNLTIIKRRIEMVDKMTEQFGQGALPKDTSVTINDDLLSNVTTMLDFYSKTAQTTSQEKRELEVQLQTAEEKLQSAKNEYESKRHSEIANSVLNYIITLESTNGGDVELDFIYQVHNASWRPYYDLRVHTEDKNSLKITYYGKISQNTGEDWSDVQLVLSTAQPCLGGEIPELGTLEASFVPPPAPAPQVMMKRATMARNCAFGGAAVLESAAVCDEMVYRVAETVENTLSTEFHIVRKSSIASGYDEQRVTIGIVDIVPQLVYECVPSKNKSVFLTASAVNDSNLVFLPGEASVYLNNSFIAKTYLKSVSPNERFSVSLGVDTAIKVDYKPVKKYHEQIGIINKSSATVTEQPITIKNARKEPILLTIKQHIPRSTDEKIKIKLIHPTAITHEEQATSINSAPATPREGCIINSKNNLEWTVLINGGQVSDMLLKWSMEHPKEEKINFQEKF